MITWETFKPEIDKAIAMRNQKPKYGKTDGNQTKVVEALRKAGLSVRITSMLGDGFPDLVVSGNYAPYWNKIIKTKTVLIELKDPSQPPSKRKLTPDEQKFHNEWRGEIYVCTTADEILKIFGLI